MRQFASGWVSAWRMARCTASVSLTRLTARAVRWASDLGSLRSGASAINWQARLPARELVAQRVGAFASPQRVMGDTSSSAISCHWLLSGCVLRRTPISASNWRARDCIVWRADGSISSSPV